MSIILFVYFALLISIIDFKTYRIPDSILAVYLLLMTCSDIKNGNCFILIEHFLAGGIAFCLFFSVFKCCKGLGFGDVKYAGIIGYAVGIKSFFIGIFIGSLVGILAFLFCFLFLKWNKKNKLPFAPFMSFGTAVSLLLIG